jgi:putative ABC transport system permease protein
VLTFTILLPDATYGDGAARAAFVGRLVENLNPLPGVERAAAVSLLPFTGAGAQSGIMPVGGTRDDERRTDVAAVTPDYFRTMGIELLRGRAFTVADRDGALPVVVVDEQFAEAMWPGDDPLGKRVAGWGRPEWTVVGVVRHVKNYGVAAESRQELYAPFAQRPPFRFWVVMRTSTEPATLVAAARGVAKTLDPQLAVYNVRPMRDIVDATVAQPRLAAFLSAAYALTGLLVVMIGIHGAISYLVVRRTREIGVRVALGATGRSVIGLVVWRALALTAVGVSAGLAGSIAAGRVIQGQLFGIAPTDVQSLGLAALVMLVAGVIASTAPAWRAVRVPPTISLQSE